VRETAAQNPNALTNERVAKKVTGTVKCACLKVYLWKAQMANAHISGRTLQKYFIIKRIFTSHESITIKS